MKNLYLLASMLLVGGFAFGQRNVALKGFEQKAAYKMTAQEGRIESKITPRTNGSREEIDIFVEDWSTGVNGDGTITTDNGVWTTTGLNGNVWKRSMTQSNGCWSFGDPALGFETVANGFVLFDADSANCEDASTDPPIFVQTELAGALVSPVIDFTEYDAVILQFSHSYRWCCTTMGISVDYSIDGTTWTTQTLTVGAANAGVEEDITINLAGLANQPTGQFRFNWASPSHYHWTIDDIRVYVPESNDLKLDSQSYWQWDVETAEDYQGLNYSIFSTDQLRPINFQGVVSNLGTAPQTNVVLNVTILGPAGVIDLASAPITVNTGETVTIDVPWTVTSDLGAYDVTIEVTQAEEDVDPSNNSGTVNFWVDSADFARDRNSAGGGFTNFDDDYKIGNLFESSSESVIYGIGFGLRNLSDNGTVFNGELLNVDLDYLAETEIGTVASNVVNVVGGNDMYYLPLEFPYPIATGEAVCPVLNHFGGEDDVIVALSGNSPAQTSFLYEGAETTWYYVTSTPMVRLLMADITSIEGIDAVNGITLSQNMPNPARDYTILVFNINQSNEEVSLEIHDMSGRLVQSQNFGKLAAGDYTEVINTEALNAGIYLYSLVAGDSRVTKRMSVVK
jgi:hypothetical protein